MMKQIRIGNRAGWYWPQDKTTTHTRGNLLGVHIGVALPSSELLSLSERTGMSVSQVSDEVLYTGLIQMQELPEL